MPMRWEPGRNPYEFNHFNKLGIGPNISRKQIPAKAQQLEQRLKAGNPIELCGELLEEFAIKEASSALL